MKISGFSGAKAVINYTGGPRPYLWIGDEKRAYATVDNVFADAVPPPTSSPQ
jgi:hypothetical protein